MRHMLGLGAVLLTALLSTPAAHAQTNSQGFNETASAASFVVNPDVVDGRGTVTALAVADGALSGSPVSGTFHVDETRTHDSGSTDGRLRGTFSMQDPGGNTISGTLNGRFTIDASGSNAQGRYSITGGSGIFAGASGSGTFIDQLSGPGDTPLLTFSGTWSGLGTQYLGSPYLPGGAASYVAPDEVQVVYVPGVVTDNNVNPPHGWDGHDNGLHKGWFKHGHGHDDD